MKAYIMAPSSPSPVRKTSPAATLRRTRAWRITNSTGGFSTVAKNAATTRRISIRKRRIDSFTKAYARITSPIVARIVRTGTGWRACSGISRW